MIIEIANNTTTGIGNNQIQTVANNIFLAVGFYPRTSNNELSGESARYQITDSWQDQTAFRDNADKKMLFLPEEYEYNYITDVANNVQLTAGWTWKQARQLDKHSQKNNYTEIANNQLTSIGWKPINNADGDGQGRQLIDIDKTNRYVDVKNNQWLNIGYDPSGEDVRKVNSDDVMNYYVDVRNTTSHTTQNNFYLLVGNKPKDERKRDKSKERSLFIDVSNEMATRVGTNQVTDVRGNFGLNVLGNALFDLHRQSTINARNELIVQSKVGVTIEAPSTTILGPLFVRDGMGTDKGGYTGSIVDINGDIFTVTNGVITGGPG